MSADVRPGRRAILAIVALLAGLVFWLFVFEGLVRVFLDEPVMPRFVIDPGYGVRANQPNVVTRHYVPGEYEVNITTNSVGMRGGREYAIEKPDGVRRILVLGDSMGFGFGVEDDEVVSAVLEDMLNAGPDKGHRYEVLNFSVSGFGQAEQLVTYRERARAYDADTVVLQYYDNDIGNNAVSNLFDLVGTDSVRRNGNDYLPAVHTRELLYSVPPVRWLFENSEAWNFVRNRLSSIVQKSLLKKHGLKRFDETQPEAVALTRALLRQFAEDVIKGGAHLTVFIIPHKTLQSNFPLTRDEVVEAGATLIDGRDFLKTGDYYKRDSHWTATGHRKAARALANVIMAHL